MERKFTGREYHFDPTAHIAIAHVTRERKHPRRPHVTTQLEDVLDEASPEDLERFRDVIFEPPRLISRGEIRGLRWLVKVREKNH